ncbi:hypothetical protein EV424DRAFT_1349096 [Suillus variegatus]|nr:hypothetical protein EV424DRAFT_1349096 [Suillus variegatus]
MIEEDRGREWGHVKWAKKVARMAQGFNDAQCHLLDVLLENTPEVLCDFLSDNYTMWTEFEMDVAKISASQLLRVKQQLITERKLCEDVDKLQNQTTSSCKTMSPTTQASYSAPPAYRYGQCFGGQPTAAPQPQTIVPPPAPQTSLFPYFPKCHKPPTCSHPQSQQHGVIYSMGTEGIHRCQLDKEVHLQNG